MLAEDYRSDFSLHKWLGYRFLSEPNPFLMSFTAWLFIYGFN